MFVLKLYDRLGRELHECDIVKISCRDRLNKYFKFYTEVKYIDEEKAINPFHTFSFHSFEKVNEVPEEAILIENEKNFKYWYIPDPEKDNFKEAEQYLMSWREFEHHVENRSYRIEKINGGKQ